MRHANHEDLDRIESLLSQVRAIDGLVERKRGTFYRKNNAALHFHENLGTILADLKIGGEWHRFPVTTINEQSVLLEKLQ